MNNILWGLIKEIFHITIDLLKLVIKYAPFYICVKIIYFVTYEKGDKDGILTKRKYRRIKQSARYKIWVWKHMRWLCKFYNLNYEFYLKYDKNKKILRY